MWMVSRNWWRQTCFLCMKLDQVLMDTCRAESVGSGSGAKDSGQKKAAASAPDDGADSDEDWSRGSKASKGKKGGKAKKPVRPSPVCQFGHGNTQWMVLRIWCILEAAWQRGKGGLSQML